ncbi:MAG: PDZ domain-containing protein [Lewinellaceae bacterium]|nr:PDZ domain-containing protein [Lewinellaceae bacterium]
MKTIGLMLATALLPWCTLNLSAQQSDASVPVEKRITIQQFTVREDGTTEEVLMEKKGQAAANFDVEAYLRDHQAEGVSIAITEEAIDGAFKRTIRSNGSKSSTTNAKSVDINETIDRAGVIIGDAMQNVQVWVDDKVIVDNRGFLGVQLDSDESANEDGVVVDVVRCSAAAMAGLRNNDNVLALNGIPVNRFSDISAAMKNAKPGDRMAILYSRNGSEFTTEAVLTRRTDLNAVNCGQQRSGYMGITTASSGAGKGVRINVVRSAAAEKAGLRNGDVLTQLNDAVVEDWEDIQDFLSDAQVGDQIVAHYRRNGKAATTTVTLEGQSDPLGAVVEQLKNTEFRNFKTPPGTGATLMSRIAAKPPAWACIPNPMIREPA